MDWLKPGKQTEITTLVQQHADQANDHIPQWDTYRMMTCEVQRAAVRTSFYIYDLPTIEGFISQASSDIDHKANAKLRRSVWWIRSADDILKEGYFPTCSDIGTLFRALMIAQGYEALFVEVFTSEYLFNPDHCHIHSLGKIRTASGELYVDPDLIVRSEAKEGFTRESYELLPYIPVATGLDAWDIGFLTGDHIDLIRHERLAELLDYYETLLKQQHMTKLAEIQEYRQRQLGH